jgi:NRAMP (natural resistance-associated macrophage protein)-like metal ion transporter
LPPAPQDPGNLEADIQAGAKTGFALLWWFALVSLCCGTAFQCLSGRLGLVSGKDLAQHCGERWPRGARGVDLDAVVVWPLRPPTPK